MRRALVTLAGAVLLLTLAMFLDHRRDAMNHADRFVFDTAQETGVNYLRIIRQNDTILMLKTAGHWITLPDSFPVDTAKIRKTLSSLFSFQSREMVSSNPSQPREYGLDEAQARHIEWRGADGGKVRVILGSAAGTDYSSTYWKWEDKPEVYKTPGDFAWEISAIFSDWKDRTLFKINPGDVKLSGKDTLPVAPETAAKTGQIRKQ